MPHRSRVAVACDRGRNPRAVPCATGVAFGQPARTTTVASRYLPRATGVAVEHATSMAVLRPREVAGLLLRSYLGAVPSDGGLMRFAGPTAYGDEAAVHAGERGVCAPRSRPGCGCGLCERVRSRPEPP